MYVLLWTNRWLQVAASRSMIWEKPWDYWRQPRRMQAATAVKPSTSPAARRRTSSWMCWVSKGSEQLSFKISMHGKNHIRTDFLHIKKMQIILGLYIIWLESRWIGWYYSLIVPCSPSNYRRVQLCPRHLSHCHRGDQAGVPGGRSALPHHSVVQRQEVSVSISHQRYSVND